MITDVVALFVDRNGEYPKHFAQWFDERRDARSYAGELPIIGHPPCQRWCRLAGLVEARWGHKRGDDGGLFAFALETVRRVGGVLEHPAYSDAWAAYGLPRPPTGGGWVPGECGGEWTCYVEQWRYGHKAKKATWLYVVGLSDSPPPSLRFGAIADRDSPDQGLAARRPKSAAQRLAWVSQCGNHNGHSRERERLGKKAAIATPPEFRAELLMLARWAVTC